MTRARAAAATHRPFAAPCLRARGRCRSQSRRRGCWRGLVPPPAATEGARARLRGRAAWLLDLGGRCALLGAGRWELVMSLLSMRRLVLCARHVGAAAGPPPSSPAPKQCHGAVSPPSTDHCHMLPCVQPGPQLPWRRPCCAPAQLLLAAKAQRPSCPHKLRSFASGSATIRGSSLAAQCAAQAAAGQRLAPRHGEPAGARQPRLGKAEAQAESHAGSGGRSALQQRVVSGVEGRCFARGARPPNAPEGLRRA